MGLNRNRELYTLKWQRGLRHAMTPTMAAEVAIFEIEGRTYIPETDEWTQTTTSWYVGKARVQPVRTTRETGLRGNETTIQALNLSIPISQNTLDFRPGLRVNVTDAPLNPSMTEFEYVLRDVVDSSNPFERTFTCTVDQETDTNG